MRRRRASVLLSVIVIGSSSCLISCEESLTRGGRSLAGAHP